MTATPDRIEDLIGQRPVDMTPLSGGCIAAVFRADMADGQRLVVKEGGPDAALALEAWMLGYLAEHSDLPVPAVVAVADDLLVMDHVEAEGPLDARAERHAADLIAALHDVTAPRFGLERDTLIGPLPQPNTLGDDWIGFFRDHRLLYMAGVAEASGALPGSMRRRLDILAGRLDRWLSPPSRPSLVHGDLWGGNVLVRDGRIAAFIDPAIYYADPEIELAFSTLFGTFGDAFFDRYGEHRPLDEGFFEVRRDLYNLYPLLVHVRLFGGAYLSQVDRILSRLGT